MWTDESERTKYVERRPLPFWLRRGVPVLLLAVFCIALLWFGYSQWRLNRSLAWRKACDAARAGQDWEELEARAIEWARREPEHAEPWLNAADAAEQRGDLADAAQYLLRIPDSDSRSVQALLKVSDWQFKSLNRPFDGADTCKRILASNPYVGEAHRRLIYFYGMTLQRKEMMQQARMAIENGCETNEAYVYLIAGSWITFSNGQNQAMYWLDGDPQNELLLVAELLHYLGSKNALQNPVDPDVPADPRLVSSLKLAEDYLDRFPSNKEVVAFWLTDATIRGDVSRVAELLGRAPADAVNDNRFWRFRGWLHAAEEAFAESEQGYLQALELNPYDWESRHELCAVLRRLGRLDEVEPEQELAMEGKAVRKAILQAPNVSAIPHELMLQMATYARHCGDHRVADRLMRRMAEIEWKDKDKPQETP